MRRPSLDALTRVMFAMLAVAVVIGFWRADIHLPSGCERGADHRLDRYRTSTDAQHLVGMHKADVLDILGDPTSERFAPEWDSSYWLRPLACVDSAYLVVEYGDADEVIRADVKAG